MHRTDIFENYSIPRSVWSLSLPLMVGMLITIICNLAGAFFLGKLNDVNQIAAISISLPVSMLLMALGSLFGMGGGSYISRMLGLKNYKRIKETSSISFYSSIVIGIIFTALGFTFMSKILLISGASEATEIYAKRYLSILIGCSPIVMLSFTLSYLVRAEGAAKESMIGMVLGTFVNIILDPILILHFHLGIIGAGLASVISNGVSVAYYCFYILKKNSLISLSLKDLTNNKEIMISILAVGMPTSLNSILISISNMTLNNITSFYGDDVVAALGIIGRLNLLPILLLIGLAQGIQPLVGYNYATENFKRMRAALKYTVTSGIIIASVFTILYYNLAPHIIGLFTSNQRVITIGTMFFRKTIISMPIIPILFVVTTAFQSFGMASQTLIVSVIRQGILYIPLLILLNEYKGLSGLIYSQPISDILTILVSLSMLLIYLKKQNSVNERSSESLL